MNMLRMINVLLVLSTLVLFYGCQGAPISFTSHQEAEIITQYWQKWGYYRNCVEDDKVTKLGTLVDNDSRFTIAHYYFSWTTCDPEYGSYHGANKLLVLSSGNELLTAYTISNFPDRTVIRDNIIHFYYDSPRKGEPFKFILKNKEIKLYGERKTFTPILNKIDFSQPADPNYKYVRD